MTTNLCYVDCPKEVAFLKTRSLLDLSESKGMVTSPQANMTSIAKSYVRPSLAEPANLKTQVETVSALDVAKMEFVTVIEDRYGELRTEEFEDTLDIDPEQIITMFRLDDSLVVHEKPNSLKLVKLGSGKITSQMVEQTLKLNGPIQNQYGTVP